MARATRGNAGQWSDSLPSSERVYSQLREMILSGELPPQTRLVELHIADQFGVSRTPVREALKRLTAEKLVLADSVRGLVVRAPEPQEIEDVYLVREALEALSAKLAAQRITPEEVRRLRTIHESLRAAVASGRREAIANANAAFHDVVHRAGGSATVSRIVKELSDFVRRFVFSGTDRLDVTVREHEAILEALERHDSEAAGAAAAAHIATARAHILSMHLKQVIDTIHEVDDLTSAPSDAGTAPRA
jgi:DNA-binding GntR family transcriptional regulator